MVKRIGTIDGKKVYDRINDWDNIAEALKEACKDHHNDPATIKVKENPEPYIRKVKEIFDKNEYYPSKFIFKTIFERGKKRRLCYFKDVIDRIIHHAIFRVIGKFLFNQIISTSFAAVPGRGMHRGTEKIQKDIESDRRGTAYCLKMDLYHYFQSIDRDVLFDMLKNRIKCYRTLKILAVIVYIAPDKNGMAIGWYSSQILSVFYLAKFGHFCKSILKIKYMYIYMDDIVFLACDKNRLHAIKDAVFDYVHSVLKLRVKGNWAIFPIMKRRLDFMGYIHDPFQVRLRKSIKLSYIRSCNRIIHAVKHHEIISAHMIRSKMSYEGLMTWCDGAALMDKYSGRVDRALEFGIEAI